jgi:16S rRNA (adenine1518-N6/adenine1519-N6)-dimethyltransferase
MLGLMQTLAEIKTLLEGAGLSPRKALGQNFLIDKNLVAKLIAACEPSAGSVVLEVGPGTGTLTGELLSRGLRVVACELDRGLAELLRQTLGAGEHAGRFELVEGDCLPDGRHVHPEAVAAVERALVAAGSGPQAGSGRYMLIANLPYAAATPLMLSLLIHHPRCEKLGVTIQKEVAGRLLAKPGTKEYGLLGIVAQSMAEVELVANLPPECFWPRPDVTSAMVLLRRRERPMTTDPAGLAALCQRVFSQRRKQLGSILGRATMEGSGIDPMLRPEALNVETLIGLCAYLKGLPASTGDAD